MPVEQASAAVDAQKTLKMLHALHAECDQEDVASRPLFATILQTLEDSRQVWQSTEKPCIAAALTRGPTPSMHQ